MRIAKPLLLPAALLLLGTAAAIVPPSLERSDAPALEITTAITPVSQQPYLLLKTPRRGMYRCSVLVHDAPGSRRVWATKDIIIGPGESGDESKSIGAVRLDFHAQVSKERDRASTIVTITRDGKVVNRQSSTVWLSAE